MLAALQEEPPIATDWWGEDLLLFFTVLNAAQFSINDK